MTHASVLTAVHQEDSQEAQGFNVSELSCGRSGETITCHFKVVSNERGKYVELITGPYTAGKSQAIDEFGNGYDAAAGTLGSGSTAYDMPVGVPVRGTLVFRGVTSGVGVFNVLRLGFSVFTVEFHRVVIAA